MKIYCIIILLIIIFSVTVNSQSNYSTSSFENSWIYITNSDMKMISPVTFDNSQFIVLPAPKPSKHPRKKPPYKGWRNSRPGAPSFKFPHKTPLPRTSKNSVKWGFPAIFGINAPGTNTTSPPQAIPSVPLNMPSEIYSLFHYVQSVPTKTIKEVKKIIK